MTLIENITEGYKEKWMKSKAPANVTSTIDRKPTDTLM